MVSSVILYANLDSAVSSILSIVTWRSETELWCRNGSGGGIACCFMSMRLVTCACAVRHTTASRLQSTVFIISSYKKYTPTPIFVTSYVVGVGVYAFGQFCHV